MPGVPLLWAEFSIQFLLPAIFLVIWVLNQIFGKAEAPPVVARDRLGPRPLPPGPSRAPQTSARPTAGAGAGAGPAVGTRGGPTPAGRPSPPREPARPATRTAPARGRGAAPPSTPPTSRTPEPPKTPRPMPATVDEVYAIYEDRRLPSQTADATPPAPVSAAELWNSPSPGTTSVGTPTAPPASGGLDRLARSGFDPERLREAILLNEVLAPPLAVRRGLMSRRAVGERPAATDAP